MKRNLTARMTVLTALFVCLSILLTAAVSAAEDIVSLPATPPDAADAVVVIGAAVCLLTAAIAVAGAMAALRKKGRETAEVMEREDAPEDKPKNE